MNDDFINLRASNSKATNVDGKKAINHLIII